MFTPRAIGHVQTPFTETGEIPKGLGAKHEAIGVLEVLPEFETGLVDIEGFSHLHLIWVDDRSQGVFATRSPRRPNPIGLTVVELLERNGRRLRLRGVDMLDGTPVLDI